MNHRNHDQPVHIGPLGLPGQLAGVPHGHVAAAGLVVFAHGSGSGRLSPRNRAVADLLRQERFATLLFDLLTAEEADDRAKVFDVDLLAERVLLALAWAHGQPALANLPLGLFGASTGAAAALVAAARAPHRVAAVVSRGGRPDLAGVALERVEAPTLLIVGSLDEEVLALNRQAQRHLVRCESRLELVRGATHLFEEAGALEAVARLARAWFKHHLAGDMRAE
jgi:pimeloyl-ACP methyl ester carboxylesterase